MNKLNKIVIVLTVACTVFVAISQILLKLGSQYIHDIISFFNIYIIIGGIIYFLGFLFYIFALKRGNLSLVAPLSSLSLIWVFLLSIFLLKESVNLIKIISIILIFAGIFLTGLGEKNA